MFVKWLQITVCALVWFVIGVCIIMLMSVVTGKPLPDWYGAVVGLIIAIPALFTINYLIEK